MRATRRGKPSLPTFLRQCEKKKIACRGNKKKVALQMHSAGDDDSMKKKKRKTKKQLPAAAEAQRRRRRRCALLRPCARRCALRLPPFFFPAKCHSETFPSFFGAIFALIDNKLGINEFVMADWIILYPEIGVIINAD